MIINIIDCEPYCFCPDAYERFLVELEQNLAKTFDLLVIFRFSTVWVPKISAKTRHLYLQFKLSTRWYGECILSPHKMISSYTTPLMNSICNHQILFCAIDIDDTVKNIAVVDAESGMENPKYKSVQREIQMEIQAEQQDIIVMKTTEAFLMTSKIERNPHPQIYTYLSS